MIATIAGLVLAGSFTNHLESVTWLLANLHSLGYNVAFPYLYPAFFAFFQRLGVDATPTNFDALLILFTIFASVMFIPAMITMFFRDIFKDS